MPALSAGIWLHRHDPGGFKSEFGRGAGGGGLGVGIPPAPPRRQGPADNEQRRRILDDHLERPQRSCRHHVEGFETLRPRLDPGMDRASVVHTALGDRTLQERALASGALDKRHRHVGQRDRQGQTGNAGAAPEIG